MSEPPLGPRIVDKPPRRRARSKLDFEQILAHLKVAVLVFDGPRIVFRNEFANTLEGVVRADHAGDLVVMLRDHLLHPLGDTALLQGLSVVRLPKGGHIAMEFTRLDPNRILVCVRWPTQDARAVAQYYGLSPRELEVATLV